MINGTTGVFSNTGTITGSVANMGVFANNGSIGGDVVNMGVLSGNGTIGGNFSNTESWPPAIRSARSMSPATS